jgi:Phosphohistidine phosphatase SixA
MTKTLVVIRHGKSTWEYEGISDYDRPLKEVGIFNTIAISQKLRGGGISPDLIISSPANRALHTAMIVARELHYPLNKVSISPALYSEIDNDVLQFIKAIDNQYNCVFIFGHNPVFTDIPNMFLRKTIDNLPTSGVVVLEFDCSNWNDISKKSIKSESLIFPKNL